MRSRESSVEPTSNCSPASGGWLCADSVAAMQAAESQTVILYYSDLRGEWPQASSLGLHRALPYGKRLQVAAQRAQQISVAAPISASRTPVRGAAARRRRLCHDELQRAADRAVCGPAAGAVCALERFVGDFARLKMMTS